MIAIAASIAAFAQKPDPNFHIYLCIGQSNMEAGARPAEQDKDFNDPRFQFVAAVDMPNLGREYRLSAVRATISAQWISSAAR